MERLLKVMIFWFLMVLTFGCQFGKVTQTSEDRVLLNQEGYLADGPKQILIIGSAQGFHVENGHGNEVLAGTVPEVQYWPHSGDSVAIVDLSSITDVDEYVIYLDDKMVPHKFIVNENPFTGLDKSAIRAFFLNRSGMAIDSVYGGQWARQSGHPDTAVKVHASAATEKRPKGTVISSPRGWYDAGDYNKYIVNSGITTFTMLQALSDFTRYFEQLDCNIPESGNALPDLLDETLYNLRWMLTMQDPNDGGVYHKLTTNNFEGFVMPHEATSQRYVVQKGTAATLDFAAVCAKAVRVLEPWKEHLPGLIDSCRQQSIDAWQWAVQNPDVIYHQPKDIFTGAYGDGNFDDEWYWASCEMFLTENDEKYLSFIQEYYQEASIPSWNNVGILGTISLVTSEEELISDIEALGVENDFFGLVDNLVDKSEKSPFCVSIDHFEWGSNSTVANYGMLKLVAHKMLGDQKYFESALSDLDYLLGRNATGYCFVTGYGQKRVMNIHHRPSAADGIENPIPGFLVGGPNLATFEDCPEAERSEFPAKSFVDLECSYSTNEIAINWNAPLVYLSGGLLAIIEENMSKN